MTKTAAIFQLPAMIAIISCVNLHAQINQARTVNYDGAGDLVTIDNISARVYNLFTMDSVKSPHIASFEMELNSSGDLKNILASLLSAAQGNQPLKLTVNKLNSQNQIIESRDYRSAMVSEIIFPDFNASSKETSKLKVKMLAQDVSVKSDINQSAPQLPMPGKGAITGNFKLVMGTLPTQRVYSINNLRITNPNFNGFLNFSVEVLKTDSKPWKDWFNTGAGGGRREKATISLMDATFSNEITSLQLPDVEILSISESSNPQSLAKTVIGLRTRRIDISDGKQVIKR